MKPTRLLYLDPNVPDIVRLVTIEETNNLSYVTLSHRWGQNSFPEPPKLSMHKTAKEPGWISIDDLRCGILQRELPRTFRDALQIATHCELKYIWIDSLCIIQDRDDNGRNPDWDQEALKMDDIYAGGLL